MIGCCHNADRTIEYRPTGEAVKTFNPHLRVYERAPRRLRAYDSVILACPRGCEPIVLRCQPEKGDNAP
jgi:hypothetical protein